MADKLFLGENDIQRLVADVADKIQGAFPNFTRQLDVIVPVLNGAMSFHVDLLSALAARGMNPEVCPIQVKRTNSHHTPMMYSNAARLGQMVHGKHVLVVDCIHDSGHTARYVCKNLWLSKHAAGVKFACLLCRDPKLLPDGFESFYGLDLDGNKEYFYGYGMDKNGRSRGLRGIFSMPPTADVPESLLVT